MADRPAKKRPRANTVGESTIESPGPSTTEAPIPTARDMELLSKKLLQDLLLKSAELYPRVNKLVNDTINANNKMVNEIFNVKLEPYPGTKTDSDTTNPKTEPHSVAGKTLPGTSNIKKTELHPVPNDSTTDTNTLHEKAEHNRVLEFLNVSRLVWEYIYKKPHNKTTKDIEVDYITDIIEQVQQDCFSHMTAATRFHGLVALCKIGKIICLSSDCVLGDAFKDRFQSDTTLEDSMYDIATIMSLEERKQIVTNTALWGMLLELDLLAKEYPVFDLADLLFLFGKEGDEGEDELLGVGDEGKDDTQSSFGGTEENYDEGNVEDKKNGENEVGKVSEDRDHGGDGGGDGDDIDHVQAAYDHPYEYLLYGDISDGDEVDYSSETIF